MKTTFKALALAATVAVLPIVAQAEDAPALPLGSFVLGWMPTTDTVEAMPEVVPAPLPVASNDWVQVR